MTYEQRREEMGDSLSDFMCGRKYLMERHAACQFVPQVACKGNEYERKRSTMAEFEFNCPQCGQTIEADESLRGQVAECPHCGKEIVVPRGKGKSQMIHLSGMKTEGQASVATGMAITDQTIHVRCGGCGQIIEVNESLKGKMMGCPHCGKRIAVPRMRFSRECDINKCYSKGTGSVKHHRYVASEGMLFDCGTSDLGYSEEVNLHRENKERASRRRLGQTYVCTHCGEVTASLTKIHGELQGCFCLILGIPLMLFLLYLGALPPMILIIGAAIFLISGIINLAQGERTKCGKCGKFNTMISVTTPQGRRLLKETGPSHGMMYSPPPPLVQPQQQDVSERLNKMQKLLDGGLISTEEYEIQRKRILESI